MQGKIWNISLQMINKLKSIFVIEGSNDMGVIDIDELYSSLTKDYQEQFDNETKFYLDIYAARGFDYEEALKKAKEEVIKNPDFSKPKSEQKSLGELFSLLTLEEAFEDETEVEFRARLKLEKYHLVSKGYSNSDAEIEARKITSRFNNRGNVEKYDEK